MLKSKLLIILFILIIGVTNLRAGDSLFVKRASIVAGSITVCSSIGLIAFQYKPHHISPNVAPCAIGITVLITGLFRRK